MAAAVGVTTGGAYVIGGLARAAVVHAQIERLANAAAHGYSETALESAAQDASALAIARQHDPYAAASAESDREDRIAAFADRLQARREGKGDDPGLHLTRIAMTAIGPGGPPLPSFALRGALDESRDLECLTQAVYYEARGEGEAGQAAVAQVVLNRTRSPSFPHTVCGVVFQGAAGGGCQFSFACDGSVHRRVEGSAWKRSERVAVRALDGFVMAEVGNATHFHVASLTTNWGPGLLRVAQIGAHVFYRFGPHANHAVAAAAPAPAAEPAKPVLASLTLAPIANTVASSVANSVAGAAEMVKSAAQAKAAEAKPAPAPAAASPVQAQPAATPASLATAPVAKADEAIKTATIS